MSDKIIKRFDLIKQHLSFQGDDIIERAAMFGFMIVGDYLFIRQGVVLEFLKIFNRDKSGERRAFENLQEKAQLVYQIFDEKSKVCRIMSVAE